MMKIIMTIILFFILAGWDLPGLLEKKRGKDLFVYSFLMLIGLTLSILVLYHIHLPNPSKGLETIFKPFSSLLKPG